MKPENNELFRAPKSSVLDKLRHHFSLRNASRVKLTGVHNFSGLAPVLTAANESSEKPQLIILETEDLKQKLVQQLVFFNPRLEAHILPGFDVSPYSNLFPSSRNFSQRVHWLMELNQAKPGQIFIADIASLMQVTIPYKTLHDNKERFRRGDVLSPEFAERMQSLGYVQTPVVEDPDTFCIRGGIIDVYSSAHKWPVRLELFAEDIESIKFFDPETQRSIHDANELIVCPAKEVFFNDENRQKVAEEFRKSCEGRDVDQASYQETLNSISRGLNFHGVDFLCPFFYESLETPLDHISEPLDIWILNSSECIRNYDQYYLELKEEFSRNTDLPIRIPYNSLFKEPDQWKIIDDSMWIEVETINIHDSAESDDIEVIENRTHILDDFRKNIRSLSKDKTGVQNYIHNKISAWKEQGYNLFVGSSSSHQLEKVKSLFDQCQFLGEETESLDWQELGEEQRNTENKIHLINRNLTESFRSLEDLSIYFRAEDFFGVNKASSRSYKSAKTDKEAFNVNFDDLKQGDLIVHKLHGVGVFEGLKVMPINGIDSEFLQLQYKDGDKLYLPVYRVNQVQKYSGPGSQRLLDKLGGTGWEKTKSKVKKHLRDIAADLLKLYAKRANSQRPAFSFPDDDFLTFENAFPYEETEDQVKAISDVLDDMTSEKPMDRLVCGDVGFGKTEVALRAAFKCVQDGKQVAMLAPTTILTFQHYQNFLKRFKSWPLEIRALNRFVPRKDIKKTLEELKAGKVDIVIGTHRLFSKDVEFKNLGLLVIDEEQKFGVKHKEKIRQLKTEVDTLTLSATPIPRTLNLSLSGIRDLSLINTAPVDRLPTRTFICRWDKETIRKAVESEVSRGGQVFFIHNRVHSIEATAAELREILPDYRIAIGHGQMPEDQLEKTILSFFNKEVDILLCTTIVESGMDIPNANTMFIDNAHAFGLSQLYQLRGRVGRGKDRAYCYLIVPQNRKIEKEAQERLRVIQENTALGSGIRIAQYDLELRGAGDFLGQEQSGHVNSVGYEMYMELLEEAVSEQKGEPKADSSLDPEINLRIQALIPDSYIPDIRLRLNYYKVLSRIKDEDQLNRLEEELSDQFGKVPEPVINLMGLMLIKKMCVDLCAKDLSQSNVGFSLKLTENTPLSTDKVLQLIGRENKKYSLTPDSRFLVRMKEVTWPRVYEELLDLLKHTS